MEASDARIRESLLKPCSCACGCRAHTLYGICSACVGGLHAGPHGTGQQVPAVDLPVAHEDAVHGPVAQGTLAPLEGSGPCRSRPTPASSPKSRSR